MLQKSLVEDLHRGKRAGTQGGQATSQSSQGQARLVGVASADGQAHSEQPRSSAEALGNPLNVDIPAAFFEAKAGNSGPLGYLHLCKGKVEGCKPTYDDECYGPGSVCYNTWQDVWDWGSQIPEGQWNGTLWRGHELGTGFLSPYLWVGRGIEPLAALGILPSQHAAIRPVLEKIWGTGGKNSAEYRQTEDMVRESSQEFLADRKKNGLRVDMSGDVMAWVHQLLYKKAFKRDINFTEGKTFMSLQLKFLSLALQSETEPAMAKVPSLLPSLRAQVASIVRSYEPMVQELYADDLAGMDCSPSKSCVTQLASTILDAFLLAGGVSLTVSINAGLALLFSTAEPTGTPYAGDEVVESPPEAWLTWGNPFPEMAYERGQELQFYWEVLRYFAPVGSVPSWTRPVKCAELSEQQTQKLQRDGGRSLPCAPGSPNLTTGIPEVNQYTGGAGHTYPVLPVAMRDPAKFGPDANSFKIRSLEVYKWSVGFGEMADNSKVANGRMNRSCPGKGLALMIGSQFFEVFDKQDWAAPRDSANITFSQGSKPFHTGFTLSSKQMVSDCAELCPSASTFPELSKACTSTKQQCRSRKDGEVPPRE